MKKVNIVIIHKVKDRYKHKSHLKRVTKCIISSAMKFYLKYIVEKVCQ